MSSDIDVLKAEFQPFVKRSITTGPGNVPGTTLVDATLVEAANFWNGSWVFIRTGTYLGQLRRVTGFAAGVVTLDHTVGGQIVTGVRYVMLPKVAVDIIAGGGLKADLRQVLGQGADLSPVNPMLVDMVDWAARLLGIVYGNLAQLQQRAVSFDLYTALRVAGAEIDPRDINPPTVVLNGQVTIAAPRVPLTANPTPCKSVTIENVSTNAVVWVGNATVVAGNGYGLRPGATVSTDIDDLNKVYVTGTVGNIVTYIAVN